MNSAKSARIPLLLLLAAIAFAAPARSWASPALNARLKAELSLRYPGARIEVPAAEDAVRWTRGSEPETLESVAVLSETPRGEAYFRAGSSEGLVPFTAVVSARVAARRVMPGERLSSDAFVVRDLNVAFGTAHEYRGVILSPQAKIEGQESRQTILEGQPLLSSQIQRTPDVRRGEGVRIEILSNGLALSTSGTAEEPGYLDGVVRVLTTKTKRQLVGRLQSGGIVEVKL